MDAGIQTLCELKHFRRDPDLKNELTDAVIDAQEAHTAMSNQVLNSEALISGLIDVLLNHAGLYEKLRAMKRAA